MMIGLISQQITLPKGVNGNTEKNEKTPAGVIYAFDEQMNSGIL